jgi:hypothetical protein
MSMGSKAPTPTDPKETSAAQTGSSVSTAIANGVMNNVNQVTPDGTLTYTNSGYETMTDPYTGQSYKIPKTTATQTLSAANQAIYDQTQGSQLNLATLANDQSGFLNDYMSQPFNYDDSTHTAWANDLYNKINGSNISDNTEAMRTQLANQGIKVGSDAYNKAMTGLQTSQMNSQNQFLLDSQNQGFSQAQATRNQPINEITALMSGSQVSQPNYVNTPTNNIATTDNASIIGNYDNSLMSQWSANQAATGSTIGALGGLFSLSDERAKTDMKKIGETEDGLGLYSYKMKGSNETEIGLKAQDVKKKKPHAVAKRPDGLFAVNYSEALK